MNAQLNYDNRSWMEQGATRTGSWRRIFSDGDFELFEIVNNVIEGLHVIVQKEPFCVIVEKLEKGSQLWAYWFGP